MLGALKKLFGCRRPNQPAAGRLQRRDFSGARDPGGDGEIFFRSMARRVQDKFSLRHAIAGRHPELHQVNHGEFMPQRPPAIFSRFHFGTQAARQQCGVDFVAAIRRAGGREARSSGSCWWS